jgi:hypothetical protein
MCGEIRIFRLNPSINGRALLRNLTSRRAYRQVACDVHCSRIDSIGTSFAGGRTFGSELHDSAVDHDIPWDVPAPCAAVRFAAGCSYGQAASPESASEAVIVATSTSSCLGGARMQPDGIPEMTGSVLSTLTANDFELSLFSAMSTAE